MLSTALLSLLSRRIPGSVASTGTTCTFIPRRTDLSCATRRIHVISMMTFQPRYAAKTPLYKFSLIPSMLSPSRRLMGLLRMPPAIRCCETKCTDKKSLRFARLWLSPGLRTRVLALSAMSARTKPSIRSQTLMATKIPTEDVLQFVTSVTLAKAVQSQCELPDAFGIGTPSTRGRIYEASTEATQPNNCPSAVYPSQYQVHN